MALTAGAGIILVGLFQGGGHAVENGTAILHIGGGRRTLWPVTCWRLWQAGSDAEKWARAATTTGFAFGSARDRFCNQFQNRLRRRGMGASGQSTL